MKAPVKPLIVPMHCYRCGQPVSVTYWPDARDAPYESVAHWPCPWCRRTNPMANAIDVVRATARKRDD